jgi:ribosomal protein L44E
MKLPSQVRRYCKFCKEHGYGSTPYPMFEHAKRLGIKQSKRIDLRYKCTKCGKMTTQKRGKKAKKLEIK